MINVHEAESAFLLHSIITICGNCYDTNAKDIVSNYKDDYGEDARIYFNIGWSHNNSDSNIYIDSD